MVLYITIKDMKSTTFSQFRNNAKKFFDAVERGETVEIYRKGKPVALLSPVAAHSSSHWKNLSALNAGAISLSKIILEERKKAK